MFPSGRVLLLGNTLKKSVKTAGFWAHGAGTGVPSLAAATSRQLTVTLFGQGVCFWVFKMDITRT